MIHVCFAIHDKAGHYSKFLGTAMCSLFENTNSEVMVHILHDNTLIEDNRDKLIKLVEHYSSSVKFYNVDELCAKEITKIQEFFPNIGVDRHSIATFYRFFILYLLPQEIKKVIYLDSDLLVNLDITELWQVKLGDKPLGAVPEFYQIKDRITSIEERKKHMPICKADVVNPEDYFNAGVILMNLKVLRNEEDNILAGMKFISEHPQFPFLDQDILNYCFSTTYLKLPLKFNRFVYHAKRENEWTIGKKIYHFAASRLCFNWNMNEPYNQMFMNYFMKTPWVDSDTEIAMHGGTLPSRRNYAVSVVIPMYNAEEFIGECLDSFLMQTFQDFEVIVVDDCSIDDSVKIVKEYMPKFNGRLKLTETKVNSGGGGNVPRNIGLLLARGDYVYFMDADDLILGTALETLYKAAIFYDAEVVYTSTWYRLNAPNEIYLARDSASRKMRGVQTEFTVDDPDKNLSRFLFEGRVEIFADSWTELPGEGNNEGAWTKFVRRDFILKNKIFFAEILTSGDFIWVIDLYCHARRFLRISTPLYFYRTYNSHSVTRTVRTSREQCKHWFSAIVEFAKALRELEKKNKVLAKNPLYCLATLRRKFAWHLNRTEDARKELSSEDIYKILHNEFAKTSSDLLKLLFPFMISFVADKKKSVDYFESMSKFKDYVTARIDVKLWSTAGDFQIVSISDKKASQNKLTWFQKNGFGYQIQSYTGELDFVVKPSVDAKLEFDLRGIDVRNPEDKTKRIPYWIDYTKLTVNGKVIFDKITPAWHDKSYIYEMNAKANEELRIQVEWIPHRNDT